ncbi:autotransporter outer membrane beta-barrel domain-containing protein [Segnochrobactrum spirostomi]|uniref:autotransporter outer membrane beta-barrel domain-containing protein n=1 Tax=Segnochrobactrum spirostomi TaxID=2608987 RepID=UPI001AD8319F|nr:autotransporter domain-containing protein [Segnochrobactrum spirostomi]
MTGNATTNACDSANGIGVYAVSGPVTMTVDDIVIPNNTVTLQPGGTTGSPFELTLTMRNTIVNATTYGALNMASSAAETNVNVTLESTVSLTTNAGFGGVWVRNEVSGNVAVNSAATIETTNVSGIDLTTHIGAVTVTNSGSITAHSVRGIYADGNYAGTTAQTVSVTNTSTGVINAYQAGIRVIDYFGLAELINQGAVNSTLYQALVAWSNNGDASISNSGIATTSNSNAIYAATEIGNATVVNSGTVTSYNDPSLDAAHALISPPAGYNGLRGTVDFSGNVEITNTAIGVVTATRDSGILAETPLGNVTVTNNGQITGATGIVANSGMGVTMASSSTTNGSIGVTNTGIITATGLAISLDGTTQTLNNSGLISTSGAIAVQTGNGNTTIVNSGWISAGSPSGTAISMGAGTNLLALDTAAVLVGIVTNASSNNTLELTGSGAQTLSGSISASGQFQGFSNLTKTGTGTWTLTGANTYSGGTTVSAGTLVGNATSLQGNIANNATVVFNQTETGVYAGAMTGTGAMTKTGAGTLILIGENTYTGGTTISEGTLQIGNGGTTGALVGAIVNNAALVFNRSDTYNFPGTISGPGSVTIIGGTVNFTGANAYAGPISVADATFELAPGAVSASSYTIGFGGVIGGTGTIGGLSVLDGGTASPGYSPGTLTVNGNVTFGSGSIYRVDVYANGAHDLITATGTATISGGTVEVIAQNGYSTPLATYTILTAQGGVSGQFASVVSNFAFLTPSLTYDANDVYLTLARNDVSFPSLATTTNQWAAANAAQSLGLGNAVYDAVLAVSTSGAPAAFDALSGEAYASASSVMQQQSSYLREAVGTRVRQGLIGQSGSGQETAKLAPGYDATVWTQAYGAWGQTAGNGNAASVDRTIGGFFTGIDAAVSEAARVGIVGGYSRSTFNVDARSSSGDIDNYDLGLYGGAKFGSLSLLAAASYTWHDLSVDRTIAFSGFSGLASSNYQAGTTQVFGEAAWRVDLSKSVDAKMFGAASLEPFANLAYVNLSSQNFTETGTPAALTGSAETENTLYSTLGVRAATVFQMANGAALTPHASLGWQHAFGDVNSSASLAFASGGSAFSVAGVPIARDAALVGAGVDYAFSKSVSASVTYSGQFGSGTEDNAFKGTINIKF